MTNMKPNYTQLGKAYNLDPRTVKKYYLGYNGKSPNRNKNSMLDEYKDIIKEKLSYEGIKISSIFFFLRNEKGYKGSYSTLTYYIRKHPELKAAASKNEGHVRYETRPGEQLQFDWVEAISLTNKHGEIFEFNVFSAELSYSRMHYFNYSKYKTREDVLVNLVLTFKFFGGIPEHTLTDNMTSIVSNRKFCKEFLSFANDMGMAGRKCKVKHAFTKGKVEVRNKFMKWLIAYNHEFETEDDLKEIIKKINIEVNNLVNDTTGLKPILLYNKEKEYLKPLPQTRILEQYMNLSIAVKVHNTMLIDYKGHQYSVPKKYINKTLKVREIDNKLYVYDNTELIVTHDISNKKINYMEDHYIEGLKGSMASNTDEQIEALAKKNLELFEQLI